MQPFPTAFWKKDNAVNLEDSCIQFENAKEDLEAGTLEQILASVLPSTPSKSETEEGAIGLYKDTFQIKDNAALTFRFSNIDHPIFGYHSAGQNTNELGLDGTPITTTEQGFYQWSSANVGGNFRQSDFHMPYAITKKHENDSGISFRSTDDFIAGSDSVVDAEFGQSTLYDDDNDYANVMSKHWLDVWMGSANGTHKTNPITMFSDCEDNKATIKCYFEKDAAQRFSEMIDNNLTDDDFPWDGGDQADILRAVRKRGFNGYYSGINVDPHFFYRQRGKVRAKFSLGSEKTVRIKIKGLGMDDNLGFNLSVNPLSQALRNPSNDNITDAGKLDGELVFLEPAVHSFSEGSGGCDLQTCKIFIDGEEKIKCTAPQIGYYNHIGFGNDLNSKSRDPNSILLERLRRRKGDTGHLIPLLSGSAAPTHKLSSKILREHKIQKLKSKPVDPLIVKLFNKNELVDVKPNNIIYGFNNNTVHDVVSGTDDINYLYNNILGLEKII